MNNSEVSSNKQIIPVTKTATYTDTVMANAGIMANAETPSSFVNSDEYTDVPLDSFAETKVTYDHGDEQCIVLPPAIFTLTYLRGQFQIVWHIYPRPTVKLFFSCRD